MKNKFNIIESAMKYKQIAILISTLLVAFGAYALFVMPRQEMPEFVIRQGVVVAAMPGATSEQIENQLAVPIENYLFGFKEVNKKKTYSQSKEGIVYIFVELNESVDQPSQFWSKLKHGLNDLKSSLPSDLYGIFVNDDFGNTSAVLISLESDTKSYKELNEISKILESRLRKVESISKLNRLGMQNEVINIYLQPEKLSYYGIKPLMIMMNFKSEGAVAYGGSIKNNRIEMPIHISSKYKTVEDIGEQIIFNDPNGNIIRLKDVSTIRREMKETDSYITNNRTKCMLLSIEMLEGNNIVQFGEEVSHIIKEYQSELPKGVKINQIANQPKIVDESIVDFLKEFGIAILAVIMVTLLLLPFRVATVAGTTIPIAILISMGVLYLFKVQLDTVTLAALIIVLGMVVDNSIVVLDNYVEKLDHKITPWQAAVESASELFIPVFTATLIIISTFAPLALFMTGTGKDFIQAFPITIAVALISSLIVAVILVPIMCFALIKTGIHNHEEDQSTQKKSILDYMQIAYDKSLEFAFTKPKTTVILAFSTVLIGLALMGQLPQELYPKMDRNQFAVEIYLPEGAPLSTTDSVVKKLENIILKDKRIEGVTSFIGSSSPRFHTVYAPNMPSKNYAQMIVNTSDSKTALALLDEYSKKYSNYFPTAHIRFKQLDMQATKAPIEIRIAGDSVQTLHQVAEKVSNIFRKNPRVSWVRNDFEEAKQSVVYDINYSEASRLGYSKFDISTYLTISQNGMPISTMWEGDYPVGIQLNKLKDKNEQDFEMKDTYIPSMLLPNLIPLRQIATPRPEWTEGQIVRRNGVRTLSVLVDVDRGVLASDVLKEESEKLSSINLPKNVNIYFGGEKEGESEQYPPLIKALLTGIIAIFFILLFQFKKISTSLIIMMTMPLSLFGAIFGLMVTGYPFGMTCFIGIISLCGVVIRNGIILVDYTNAIRKEQNLSVKEAAIAGGKRRMRPIFLTSAAAAVGVIPMIISKSLLWAPLASVLSFGLMFSMVLTLITLPVLYWFTFRKEDTLKELSNNSGEAL